jgi:hypothetical protein
VLGDLVAIARGGGSTWGPLPAAGPSTGDLVAPPARESLMTASGIHYPIDD